MRDHPFETRVFPAENLKFLNVKTFRGNIELIGADIDVVEVSTFGSVRNWENMFFKTELRRNHDNHTLFALERTEDIWNINPYSSPSFWDTLTFFSISFRIRLP